jgi:hypothetical protein
MSKTQIATGGLADNAVVTGKITDGTIATGDIADDAVTNTKLDLSETYNFTAMPQKGGNGIVATASNSNGRYIKFADGSLICTVAKSVSEQNNGASAGNFYSSNAGTWTYPLAFNAAPRVIAQVIGGHYNAISAKAVSVGTSSTTYLTMSINSTTNAQGLELFAIGTWE